MEIQQPGPVAFTQLVDAPTSYVGAGSNAVTVNVGASGLVFTTPAGGGRQVYATDLSSQLNGSLKTFTIPSNFNVILVIGSAMPFVFRPTTDYTGSGTTTLTFDASIDAPSSLAAGQSLIVVYS